MEKFELTNTERLYFGLSPIEERWDRILWKDTTVIFYENDVIRKVLYYDPHVRHRGYQEYDYELHTRERKALLPKTPRGKEKSVTSSHILSCKPFGVSFYCKFPSVLVYHPRNEQTLAQTYEGESITSYHELRQWIQKYLKESPRDHFKRVETLKTASRKNVKYTPGDFFAFDLDRFSYGFGRILADIHKIRKRKLVDKEHNFNSLFGHTQLIAIYVYSSQKIEDDVTHLKHFPLLPSFYITDNKLFYGTYPIIGHLPLEADELDFPMGFQTDYHYKPLKHIFQWGLGSLTAQPNQDFERFHERDFRYVSTHQIIYGFKNKIKHAQNGLIIYDDNDLRSPDNRPIRDAIFKHFGLPPELCYDTFAELAGTVSSQELLDEIKIFV